MKTLSILGRSTVGLFCLTLTSLSAHADLIRCTFTEPFISTVYSTTRSTLTIYAPGESGDDVKTVLKNVSLQIVGPSAARANGPAEIELRDAKNRVIQKLTLNHEGSDGMSDYTYPYDAQYNTPVGGQSTLSGGCYSNALPRSGSDS